MKSSTLTFITATTLFSALAISVRVRLAAQEQPAVQGADAQHTRYKLVDLGTFGGPSSYLEIDNGVNGAVNQVVNNRGTVAGWGDTSTPDPFAPNCFDVFESDCFLRHAFQWQKGVLTDLGVLPGGDASTAAWISDTGLIAGQARNGLVDPLIPGFPEFRAVLWKDGKAIDLGTLGGNESSAFSVNDRGQVVGVAVNTIPDPFSFLATQLRAFLWQGGAMQDLGTLGGPEAWALFVNERGQVAGFSLTNAAPNPTTGFPTQDPFLWENGTMLDLGTLGGTFGWPYSLNNRGEVVGPSNLSGDLTFHPFLWDRGVLTDLGTLGGDNGQANSVSDAGEIVGKADLPGPLPQTHDAFLWKNGVMTDLGTQDGDPCSNALNINSKGQIVGGSSDCFGFRHAFLWEHGGPMIDLNTLVAPSSGLTLTQAGYINDRGEIAGAGVLPDGDTHAFLLIPCGEGEEGCGDNATGGAATTESTPALVTQRPSTATPANPALSDGPRGMLDRLRSRWGLRYHFPGALTRPAD
jgi:probable HAF family extracellular repeat protein